MNDEVVLFLQLIDKNGNIENLTRQGYQYSQVAMMVDFVIDKRLVEFSSQGMFLTDIGKDVVAKYNKKLNRKNSEAIISPQKEYVLEERKSIYDIYLPSKINNII